uniref:Uncharacterized protein n=1 Tax=Rhizophora mucronata TaxID=61149 RepID=A0A2P2QQ06_RHIMU
MVAMAASPAVQSQLFQIEKLKPRKKERKFSSIFINFLDNSIGDTHSGWYKELGFFFLLSLFWLTSVFG